MGEKKPEWDFLTWFAPALSPDEVKAQAKEVTRILGDHGWELFAPTRVYHPNPGTTRAGIESLPPFSLIFRKLKA